VPLRETAPVEAHLKLRGIVILGPTQAKHGNTRYQEITIPVLSI
jgi:hypothetical protein